MQVEVDHYGFSPRHHLANFPLALTSRLAIRLQLPTNQRVGLPLASSVPFPSYLTPLGERTGTPRSSSGAP